MSEETPCAYYVRRREFLNEDPDLPGFIIGIVEDTRAIPDDQPKEWANGYIALDLADCRTRISFYFDMSDRSERANSLGKINLIAEVVNAVRDGIALEVESRNARPEPTKVEAEAAKTEVEPAQAEVDPTKVGVEPDRVENSAAQFSSNYITTLGL
jgi:hypothetical protein